MDSLATKEEISGCVLVHALLQKLDKATQAKLEEVLIHLPSSSGATIVGKFFHLFRK